MIIVEGPDGAGKSTLIEQLKEDLGNEVFEPNYGPRVDLPNKAHRIWNALQVEFKQHTLCPIYDRLYFSELVYGPLLRGYNLFTTEQRRVIEPILRTLCIPVIFCLPPRSVVEENLHKGETHLEGVLNNISEIYEQYQTLTYVLDYSCIYDYTEDNPVVYQELLSHCRDYITQRKARLWSPS